MKWQFVINIWGEIQRQIGEGSKFFFIPTIPKFLKADINTTAKILENTND